MNGERATVALAAQALYAAARSHKREAEHHRRQARRLSRQLDDLRRECAKRGITLVLVDTAPKEAQS